MGPLQRLASLLRRGVAASLLTASLAISGCYLSHEREAVAVADGGPGRDAGAGAHDGRIGDGGAGDAWIPDEDGGPPDASAPDGGAVSGIRVTSGVLFPRCDAPEPGLEIILARRSFDCGDNPNSVAHIEIVVRGWPLVGGSRTYAEDGIDVQAVSCPGAHVCDATTRAFEVALHDFQPGDGAGVSWRLQGGGILHAGAIDHVRWCGDTVSCE